MRDERVGKLARILVDYSIGAGKGDQVLVSAEVGAGPLIGALYAQIGGKNDSSVHTDLVCGVREGGELYADGELIQEDGRFQEFDLAGVNDAR
jgi:leucyl aminopeptidase (aminopeptidase T)